MPTDKTETLAPGTEFVANYKKTRYTATVREDGIYVDPPPPPAFERQPFKTLSGAGRAVMGGIACNGWRFWSLANGEPTARTAKAAKANAKAAVEADVENDPKDPDTWDYGEHPEFDHSDIDEDLAKVAAKKSDATAARPRLARQIKRVPNQKGVEEGKTRWFCSACMAGFQEETGITPATCPQGLLAMVPDVFTGVAE